MIWSLARPKFTGVLSGSLRVDGQDGIGTMQREKRVVMESSVGVLRPMGFSVWP